MPALVAMYERAAESHDGQVDQVELGPLAQKQPHRLTALQAQPGETASQGVDTLAQPAPGQTHLVVEGAYGDAIRPSGRRAP